MELATRQEFMLEQRQLQRVAESLVLKGDISGLTAEERTRFYLSLCEQLGLNPATQPLAILRLNGKEVLYPTRGATDQLAAIHRLNREIIDGPKVIDVAGNKIIFAVARITHPNGRIETATAMVALPAGGENICNAFLKTETKAKRRGTLSILGLGMLDETEIESIPAAAKGEGTPINLGALAAKHAEVTERSEEPTHLGVVESYRRALQSLESYTNWTLAALWIEWEPALREECESETLHDLQMEAKGCAPDATSMAAWKFAVDATRAASECAETKTALQLHVLGETGGDFVAGWRVQKGAIGALAPERAKLCWELYWRGYGRVTKASKPQEAFRKALGGDVPPDSTKGGRTRGEAAASAAEGTSEASATTDAPQASVSYLVPNTESARYVASATEWYAHCLAYRSKENALNSWAKHCAAFRSAGVFAERRHVAALRYQALTNCIDTDVAARGLDLAERTAEANARKHAEAATTLRKAG